MSGEKRQRDYILVGPDRLTVARIRSVVAEHYGITLMALSSERSAREVARPRQVAMYLARDLTRKSLPDIGRIFNRDHTTVMYGIRTIERLRQIDERIANDIAVLRDRLAA